MRRGFQCWRGRHIWVDFVVGPFFMALRGFSLVTPVFPSPQKPTFPNSNSTRYQEDQERPSGYAASKSLLIDIDLIYR